MSSDTSGGSQDLTRLLNQVSGQGPKSLEQLFKLVYKDLHRIAEARLAYSPPWRTIDPTALVHEYYIRLFGKAVPTWECRQHFFRTAARVMQRILVDRARKRTSLRNGGGRSRVPLGDDLASPLPSYDPLVLDELIEELGGRWPERAELVRLRFFAGLTEDQIADVMNVSRATIGRLWPPTKAWLAYRLGPDDAKST